MATLQIRQTRSSIGCKQNQRDTLRSLGLRRVNQVVEREDNPVVRGMIQTVTHLVAVEEQRDDERGTKKKSSATTSREVD